MVGERPPRATEMLLDLGLEGAARPMDNWAGLLAPSLATEKELEELVPGLLGMMALSWWCCTLARLLACCGASLIVAHGLWGEAAVAVGGMAGGWAKR